jgi:hypothetical protein
VKDKIINETRELAVGFEMNGGRESVSDLG